ncbi:unnamed protein product (macronuclear) [Paramecium tetraurelia]|uniref:Trichohyalin-plectin-homology domain-containing protein n=1 Tax=Paramecium tetraurelia TaxID=5888 RepID=A0BPQ6_PARTE|nr:uncharacterized protein GSPATT00005273001 [Paramecium tetraurelia]CAK60523.1 unnamed protein product [Paramecium tetraurelia]|eukprot:XP_001427921.1 hypothetical protein (macronuclear) [Paramecium tetraurelia strain d4-2]
MDKDLFIQKYGQKNSIQQIFLRKAYHNFFMLRSSVKKDLKKVNRSVDPSKFLSTKIKTDQSKSSFVEVSNITNKDNISQMTEFHYNNLRNKWLMDEKQNEAFIQILQKKRKQLELEEKQRQLEVSKIQQAILLRENLETDRKRQFYKEAELFRNQQSERRHLEQEKLKSKEQEYLFLAKRMAENEELAKLEQQIVHRQKCKMQFQMLEQQRRTNSFLLS